MVASPPFSYLRAIFATSAGGQKFCGSYKSLFHTCGLDGLREAPCEVAWLRAVDFNPFVIAALLLLGCTSLQYDGSPLFPLHNGCIAAGQARRLQKKPCVHESTRSLSLSLKPVYHRDSIHWKGSVRDDPTVENSGDSPGLQESLPSRAGVPMFEVI
jgi:hypothetical protein